MTKLEKVEIYVDLVKNISGLLTGERDFIANLANSSSAIQQAFGNHWVGFYRVQGNELVLGPFQGPVACTRIKFGKGVCGNSWEQKRTIIVDDVHQFAGHIACSEFSKSEIVVPVIFENKVIAVLDIDSVEYAAFDQTDSLYLEEICRMIAQNY